MNDLGCSVEQSCYSTRLWNINGLDGEVNAIPQSLSAANLV